MRNSFVDYCSLEADNLALMAQFTRAIVRPPAPNFAQGLTSVDLGVPDYRCALQQHQAYCDTLRSCGLSLVTLDPDVAYPDSTFVEDTAVITQRGVVLTRPGATSRGGEVKVIGEVLGNTFGSLSRISAPGTLDGGDICEAGDHFFIGISKRTNESGAKQLASFLTDFGYTSSLIDIRDIDNILHLKSGVAFLGNRQLVLIEALLAREEFRSYDIISVPVGEEYAANCVAVNGGVLIAAGFPVFEQRLRDLGFASTPLEMSEFQKMDGGLSCLSLRF
ncbi:MAG TPA: arginine deiminase family protein [Pyrinomonadaceae bacterium]